MVYRVSFSFSPSAYEWRAGVSAQLQPAVQRQMAYAAGRYMHVIFPEAVHEPALALSERLLASVGRGWAGKVFFSDDGCAEFSPLRPIDEQSR